MKSLRIIFSAFAVMCCSMPGQAVTAKKYALGKTKSLPEIGQRTIRPNLSDEVKKSGTLQIENDALSGAPRFITGNFGINLAVDTKNKMQTISMLEASARTFVRSNPDIFGALDEQSIRLDEQAILLNDAEQFLKFRVYKDGVRVVDASIDFRFKFGKLLQVQNDSYAEASFANAFKALESKSTIESIKQFSQAKLVDTAYRIAETKKGYQAVLTDNYEVMVNGEPFSAQIDVHNGSVFELKPLHDHIDGQALGQIFKRHYREDLIEQNFSNLEVKAGTNTATTDADGSFTLAADKVLVEGLRGPMVDVKTLTGTLIKREGALDGNIYRVRFDKQGTATMADDKDLAQSMLFQHVNKMVLYARKYISSPWFGRRLVANANWNDSCNAHWDRRDGSINFYSADAECPNTALISDVVYHEWGHGLDQMTGGIEDSAFSEGFGDIMALLMTRDHNMSPGFFLANANPLRDLAVPKIYPRDRGEVHAEGLIIGSTFYDLYTELKEKYDDDEALDMLSNFAFKMIFTASKYTDVYRALLVIDDNDANLENTTPHFCSINKVFTKHGLATKDSRCVLGAINSLGMTETTGNGNNIIEPGETMSLQPSLFNTTAATLSGVTGTVSISPAVSGITVGAGVFQWGDIAPGTAAKSDVLSSFAIGPRVLCGVGFNLRFALKGPAGEATIVKPMKVGKLVGAAEQLSPETLPVSIPDSSSVDVPVSVTSRSWEPGMKIENANLAFKILHTYVGDLEVDLVAPSGATKQVYKGSGSAHDVDFNADITDLVEGEDGAGTWMLKVTDSAANDVGSLEEAALTLTPALYVCN